MTGQDAEQIDSDSEPTDAAPTDAAPTDAEQIDVVVIGAGLSGIDVAHRVREADPELTLAVLEAREALGGTWDLFRYPGIRSDSDFFTLCLPFRPWRGRDSIVEGEQIREYLAEATARTGLDKLIRYRTQVVAADWSSERSRWHLSARTPSGDQEFEARFVVFCTGYYDYEQPHDPGFAGLEDFTGRLVHPQFWPDDLDHTGARVLVVGSGATAITLVPALAPDAAHVTMLQRTPTYVLAQPRRDALADLARRVLPATAAQRLVRDKNIVTQWLLYRLCRRFPSAMRNLLRRGVIAGTGSEKIADEAFDPPYRPWEQRLCIAADGDLFAALRDGSASVVTARIDRFVAEGVRLEDGRVLPADIVITATGLKIKLLGGIRISREGREVDLSSTTAWHGTLLSGLPNLAICIGYINLSWTVRADLTARLIGRLLRHLRTLGAAAVEAVPPADPGPTGPFMDMQSGYLSRAAAQMPRVTRRYPWAVRQDVMVDGWHARRADLNDGLVYTYPQANSGRQR